MNNITSFYLVASILCLTSPGAAIAAEKSGGAVTPSTSPPPTTVAPAFPPMVGKPGSGSDLPGTGTPDGGPDRSGGPSSAEADPARDASNSPAARSGDANERLDSRPRGYPTLNEYLARGPALLEEQAKVLDKSRRFSQLMQQYQARHEATAAALNDNSGTSQRRASNLGSLPTESYQAQSQNAPMQPLPASPSLPEPGTTQKLSAPVKNYGSKIKEPVVASGKLDKDDALPASFSPSTNLTLSGITDSETQYPTGFATPSRGLASAAGNGSSADLSLNGKSARKIGSSNLRDTIRRQLAEASKKRAQQEQKGELLPETGTQQVLDGFLPKKGSGALASYDESASTPGFTMKGSETDAEIARLTNEASLSSLPGAESLGLFLRVHHAHQRWKKHYP